MNHAVTEIRACGAKASVNTSPGLSETCSHRHDSPCRHCDEDERQVFVVCCGTECRRKGASKLVGLLRKALLGDRCERTVRVGESRSCMGHCATAPVMMRNGNLLRWVSLSRLKSELIALHLTLR